MWWLIACHSGDPSPKTRDTPSTEENATPLIQIEVGVDIICAIDTEHQLKCWGDHAKEALSHPYYSSILNEPPIGKYTQVALTQDNDEDTGGPVPGCALGEDALADCWSTSAHLPQDKAVAMGISSSNLCVAVMGGGVHCRAYSKIINTDINYVQVWAGYTEVCALTETKDLDCWDVITPEYLASYAGAWVDVSMNVDTCMLHQTEGIFCDNGDHNLDSIFPNAHGIKLCMADRYSYCILQEDGMMDCVNYDTPQFDTPLQTISCSGIWEDDGARHFTACGLVGDGTARCWNDYRGQWSLP